MATQIQVLPPDKRLIESTNDVAEYMQRIEAIRKAGLNLLAPAEPGAIKPFHRIHFRLLELDAALVWKGESAQSADLYHSPLFHRDNKNDVSLTSRALKKLLNLAGGNVLEVNRTDDGAERLLRSYGTRIEWTRFDGSRATWYAGRTLDLRDGSEALKGKAPAQIAQARERISELCATMALSRTIRQAFPASDGKMSVQQAARAWVVPCLQLSLDMEDEQQRAVALFLAAAPQLALYGAKGADMTGMLGQLLLPASRRPAEASAALPEGNAPAALAAPQETSETEATREDEEPEDEQAKPSGPLCGCPHGGSGCLAEVNPETAARTMRYIGSVRCRNCYPGESFLFDDQVHPPDVPLEIKKNPEMTPRKLRELLDQRPVAH